MKILFVAPRFHTNMHAYVKGLKEMGHEVFFLALYRSNSENYEEVEPLILKSSCLNYLLAKINSKYKKEIHYWPSIFDLRQQIKNIAPDVLLVKNLQGGLAFWSFFWGRKYARKVFALVQTEKHALTATTKKIVAWVFKKLFKVHGIITPLANVLPETDPWFSYLPFVIEVKDFEKNYFIDDKINILEVGKFQRRKNHLLILEAINKLRKKYPLRLIIVGERYDSVVLSAIKSFVKEKGLDGVVEIKENLPYREALSLYNGCDLFVLPSSREPAAYSVVEAMAAKLPVIVSDTCGTSCYIQRGQNGYVFKSDSLNDLVNKLELIIGGRDSLIKMGEKSFAIAKAEHSLEIFKERIEKIFRK